MKKVPPNVAHALQHIDSELASFFVHPEALKDRICSGAYAISILTRDVTLKLTCGHSVDFTLKSLLVSDKDMHFEVYEQALHVSCLECGHQEFIDGKTAPLLPTDDPTEVSVGIEATIAVLRAVEVAKQAERQAREAAG